MNTLQDFLDQQPALAPPPPESVAVIALRMKSAFLKATVGASTDLAPIKVEADKLADPEKDALRTAFDQFIDFHQATVIDGVVPAAPPPPPPE